MMDIIGWGLCTRKFIRKVEPDPNRISSLQEKARWRLQRAKNTEVSEKTVSFIVEDYYEVIKELLVAYLLKNGLKSANHQCLISYFYQQNSDYEREALLMAQMSFFRNRLDYYGESVPLSFYIKNKEEFLRIIELLEKVIAGV